MKHYEVTVTVHGATPPTGRPVKGVTFIPKANSPEEAAELALEYAKAARQKHPRIYKNATFSVLMENIKLF